MKHFFAVFIAFSVVLPVSSDSSLDVYPLNIKAPVHKEVFGVNLLPYRKSQLANPKIVRTVNSLGFGSIRFPNGCVADLYNWKIAAEKGEVTVGEFLDFCERIKAEPFYTINMQGGTEGLEGPIPEGAPLEEAIRYKHTAPNPCGYTHYHFGTLQETLDLVKEFTINRALQGKKPLIHYEMGNENWGQAKTDWTPKIYAKTVEVYASAMRQLIAEAKKNNPALKGLEIRITAVGYPIMGNNQKDIDTPDYKINQEWTQLLNALKTKGLIDSVQEHFYPWGLSGGETMPWSEYNFKNILDVRMGLKNPRLNGYRDESLAYNMPVVFTEWNLKCWGNPFHFDIKCENGSFEKGLDGWIVVGGKASISKKASRKGDFGLLINADKEACEVSQIVDLKGQKLVQFSVWVRSKNPELLKLILRGKDGKEITSASAVNAKRWAKNIGGGHIPENIREAELVIRAEKGCRAEIDDVTIFYNPQSTNLIPLSAGVYEQQLFCVDILRAMVESNIERAHFHHLFGNHPCGVLNENGSLRDNYFVFAFYSGAIGENVVRSDCRSSFFDFQSILNKWATPFNALSPSTKNVPVISALATSSRGRLYILLVNRSTDRNEKVTVRLHGVKTYGNFLVRMLRATDFDTSDARIDSNILDNLGTEFDWTVPAHSADILIINIIHNNN